MITSSFPLVQLPTMVGFTNDDDDERFESMGGAGYKYRADKMDSSSYDNKYIKNITINLITNIKLIMSKRVYDR